MRGRCDVDLLQLLFQRLGVHRLDPVAVAAGQRGAHAVGAAAARAHDDHVWSLPARRVPEAVKALVAAYKADKKGDETLQQWVVRAGRAKVKEVVAPFTSLPAYEQNPEMYFDWGDTSDFKAEIGVGECAA